MLIFSATFYNKQLAENIMFQLSVLDIEATFKTANQSQYKTKITPVKQEHWGKVLALY